MGHARPHAPAENHLWRRCAPLASAASSSIARIIAAATQRQSTPIDGRIMFGCQISSRASPAKHAVRGALTSAPIGLRPKPMREKGWSREFDGPVDLQHGRQLVTLEDAGNYITKASESRAFRSGMASGDG